MKLKLRGIGDLVRAGEAELDPEILVKAGLEALIAREVGRRLIALGGTQPDFEAGPRRRPATVGQ